MAEGKRRKIAFLSHLDMNLYLFRLSWMKALQNEGHEVIALVPRGEYFYRFEEHGIRAISYDIDRGGMSPFGALFTIKELIRIMKRERFDIVHAFTIKPNVFGSIAGRLSGVPIVINHVTGLGYVYTEKGTKAGLLRLISNVLYWLSFSLARKVIFQNPDDLNELGGLAGRGKAAIVRGTGVDTDYFSTEKLSAEKLDALRRELSLSNDSIVVTVIARLLWHKGIREFVDAARSLSNTYEKLVFLVVGWRDEDNPAVVNQSFIDDASSSGSIRFLGKRDDVREILAVTDIYVLPSYREGTPRTVLEAMAMGKPVITTDVPGCRQAVSEGLNGFLVPPGDSTVLADAIMGLVDNRALRIKLGNEGRVMVEREFSDRVVVSEIIRIYNELIGG